MPGFFAVEILFDGKCLISKLPKLINVYKGSSIVSIGGNMDTIRMAGGCALIGESVVNRIKNQLSGPGCALIGGGVV
jgi:hypothetical protein